jgi:hypothetical protein
VLAVVKELRGKQFMSSFLQAVTQGTASCECVELQLQKNSWTYRLNIIQVNLQLAGLPVGDGLLQAAGEALN